MGEFGADYEIKALKPGQERSLPQNFI